MMEIPTQKYRVVPLTKIGNMTGMARCNCALEMEVNLVAETKKRNL